MASVLTTLVSRLSTAPSPSLLKTGTGASLAYLVLLGLALAGVVVPGPVQAIVPIVAGLVYAHLVPPTIQAKVDSLANELQQDIAIIPKVYSAPSDFPEAPPTVVAVSNINKAVDPKGS